MPQQMTLYFGEVFLITDAYYLNMHPLVADLHKTLHFELRNEELPVMKARLKYLVDNANEQDFA